MGRQLADCAVELAIPVDFAGIGNLRQVERYVRRRAGGKRNRNALPVPRVAGIAFVSLQTPRLAGSNLLPAILPGRVVRLRLRPGNVVAQVKLPGAVERNSTLA